MTAIKEMYGNIRILAAAEQFRLQCNPSRIAFLSASLPKSGATFTPIFTLLLPYSNRKKTGF